jgi:phasin
MVYVGFRTRLSALLGAHQLVKASLEQARAGLPRVAARIISRMPPSEPRMTVMADPTAVSAATPKSKKPVASAAAPAFEMPKFELPKFEIPKFEMPKFEMPNMEMPAAFREFAEKGIAQAKENYEKVKGAAEQATDMMEDTYSTASKGCTDYGLKLIETARANSNAAFDLFGELLIAKSYAEVVEKSTAYVRAQFDAVTTQTKELSEHAQKVCADTAEPIKEGFASFTKAA